MSGMDAQTLDRRQNQLRRAVIESNLSGFAINPGPSLTYLTGLHFHLSERPVVFLIPAEGRPSLVLPELESQKVSDAALDLASFTYTESLDNWAQAFDKGMQSAGLRRGAV